MDEPVDEEFEVEVSAQPEGPTTSGVVAILNETRNAVSEVRDYGETVIYVKPGAVLPFEVVRPELGDGEQWGEFTDDIQEDKVVRTFAVVLAPLPSVDEYKRTIERLLDKTAQERRYDNSVSIATYINSTVPSWAFEATAFVEWRDGVWAYAYTELDKVMHGQRPQPTLAAFMAELPTMEWPA